MDWSDEAIVQNLNKMQMKARQQQQQQRPDISKCKSDSVVPSGKHLYIDFQYMESVDVCWLT